MKARVITVLCVLAVGLGGVGTSLASDDAGR